MTGNPLGKTTTFDLIVYPPCPVPIAATDDGSTVQTLHRFRDEVMRQSPDRRRYVELFYRHAWEGSRILLADPGLRSRVAAMLSRFRPVFVAAIDRRPATLNAADVNDIDALIQAFMGASGHALRADLGQIRQRLRDGALPATFGIHLADSR